MALTTVRSTGIGSLPAISGANLTSLNASNISSGTLNSARFSGGKILQVIMFETTSATATTNSNLQDTSLAQNITPSSTSSKILIQVQPCMQVYSTNREAGGGYGISREIDNANNTTVWETKYSYDGIFVDCDTSGANEVRNYPYVSYLDSPNTTGVCRYKFRIKAYNSDNCRMSENSGRSTMYLYEVAS
tara:strand:+ start:117 stop:686 length:570 start_codon:yes stop_codon:yes gene_type:complete